MVSLNRLVGVIFVTAVFFSVAAVQWAQLRPSQQDHIVTNSGAKEIATLQARLAASTKAHAELKLSYDALKERESERSNSTLKARVALKAAPEVKKTAELSTAVHLTNAPPFTLVYALVGNSDGQILELAASLKSVFKNLGPPPPGSKASPDKARIFLVCDEQSAPKVWKMLSTELGGDRQQEVYSGSNVNIDIQTVVLSAKTLEDWEKMIRTAVKPFELAMRHTFGTYIRLFLHLLIPPPVDMPPGAFDNFVIYADTDLVFLIDLQLLFSERRLENVVQFGPSKCAGLLLLNLARLPKLLADLPSLIEFERMQRNKRYGYGIDDQMMLNAVEDKTPELVGKLSLAWDGHLINHGRKRGDAVITEEGFAFGVLHFNGGGGNPGAYYEYKKGDWKFAGKQDWIKKPGWKLAQYYSGLPWIWLRLHLKWAGNSGRIHAHPIRTYDSAVELSPTMSTSTPASIPIQEAGTAQISRLGSCGVLRKYPAERAYGLNKPSQQQPSFLRLAKYIRGVQPKPISPPKGRAKACIIKPSPREPTSTDGLNPSTVFFKKGHFLTLIGDSMNGDNQCIYPKPKNIKAGGVKRALLLLQGANFETITQVEIELRSTVSNPKGKWGKAKLKDRMKRPPAITDSRLRWFGDKLMISFYSGQNFGYDNQLFQELHLQFDDAQTLTAAYIYGEETQKHCCGRNFAFFLVPGDAPNENGQGYYAEWLLPPKFRALPATTALVQRSQTTQAPNLLDINVLYKPPAVKVHGTSPSLVHIPMTDELLTITHVHRPPGRPGATSFALHGHHYTHFFVTFDRATFKLKRISNEFCFSATDDKSNTELVDCDIIQFASGLDFSQHGKFASRQLAISWGINDCEGAVGLFDWSMIDKLLLPFGNNGEAESELLASIFL